MATSCVYVIETDRPHYVGSSQEYEIRRTNHIWMLAHNVHSNKKLQKMSNQIGVGAFSFRVLEIVEPDKLVEREKYWIDYLIPDCNLLTPQEDGRWTHAEEISQIIAYKNKGQKRSEESKKRMSEIQKERRKTNPVPYEHIMKMVEARKGLPNPHIKECPYTKEELVEMLTKYGGYSNLSRKKFNGKPSKGLIKRWCIEFDIPYRAEDYGKKIFEKPLKADFLSVLVRLGNKKDVANYYGCSTSQIQHWCCHYGIQGYEWSNNKKADVWRIGKPNKEELFKIFNDNGINKTAQFYQVHHGTVERWLESYGIPWRKR